MTAPPELAERNGTSRGLVLSVGADDASFVRIRETLQKLGADIARVEDVPAALHYMCAQPPSLLLVGAALSNDSELDLLHRLRDDSLLCQVPVMCQRSRAEDDPLLNNLDSLPPHCYLTSAFDSVVLLSVVRGALVGGLPSHAPRVVARAPRLELLREARFTFRTLLEAQALAVELSQVCPEPSRAELGLVELLINAVEHGNLEISYEYKSMLCWNGGWRAEIARRLQLAPYASREVSVRFERDRDALRFEISDEGPGFGWHKFLDFDPDRSLDPNGRGIALARNVAFTRLRYREPGNVVVAEIALEPKQ